MWALGLQEMAANESADLSSISSVKPGVTQPPPLSQIFLSLESQPAKLKAINHAMQTLRILCCRELVSCAIKSKESAESVSLDESSHFMTDVEHDDSFETESQLVEAQKKAKIMEKMAGIQPETITSVDQLGMSATDIQKRRTRSQVSKSVSFLSPDSVQPFMQNIVYDCNSIINFLRLVIPSPSACSYKNVLSQALSLLARSYPLVADSIADSCVSILEEIVASPSDSNSGAPELRGSNSGMLMQPVIQESEHPYRTDSHSAGVVTIPGAKSLRVQFDFKCYTEPNKDILTLMDGQNNIIEQLSGRVYADWNAEICVIGDTLKWRFSATSNVNLQNPNTMDVDEGRHWGWCFMVFPSPGGGSALSKGPVSTVSLSHLSNALLVSDRQALSHPCFEVVKHLLDNGCLIVSMVEENLVAKLALALASCAQLSHLG